MEKNHIQRWFNFFKAKKEQTIPAITSITPSRSKIEEFDLPLNKFGKPECLVDQCENQTCSCQPEECKIDNQICYESMMMMDYIENMKKAQRAKKST